MASASSTLRVAPHPYGVDNTQRRQIVYGTCILSPSGTYINTSNALSGIPLNWGLMQDGNSASNGAFIPQVGPWTNNVAGQVRPQWAEFQSIGNETTIPGYVYVYNQTPTGSSTLRIIGSGTELTNNAAITADNIQFRAEFIRGI